MNGEVLQRIVEEIVSRLQRRAHSKATLSVAQLRDADCPGLFSQHASLCILLVDLPLLGQLTEAETDDPAARKIHDALAFCTASCCRLSRSKNWRACRRSSPTSAGCR